MSYLCCNKFHVTQKNMIFRCAAPFFLNIELNCYKYYRGSAAFAPDN